ncbi:zinc finger protein [Bounagaea algeriensis]
MRVPRLDRQGPVVYWRPWEGLRHALDPSEPPQPGRQRTGLCGTAVEVRDADATEWLAPTCPDCWAHARELRDARVAARAAERAAEAGGGQRSARTWIFEQRGSEQRGGAR